MNKKDSTEQFPLLPLQVELIDRLRWFTRLRWVAAVGVLATVLAAKWLFGFEQLQLRPLLSLLGVIVILNLGYVFVLHKAFPRRKVKAERDLSLAYIFTQVQILLDLILLTLLLHYSGGLENPFNFFYIFHVIISSILLPRRIAYAYAFIAVALYSGLILTEQAGWISRYSLVGLPEMHRTYLLGVIFAFGATVFIAAYVTTSIRLQLKQREEEAEQVRETLFELEEQKSSFMRMVSHELRSPIAAIQSSLGVLLALEDKCMDDTTRHSVQRAADRAQGLYQLTRDLLEFSRLTTLGPKEEQNVELDFKKVVNNAEALYRNQAADRKIEFDVTVPDRQVVMLGDPQSLDQMVDNLVSNAIRYTPEGGRVTVELTSRDNVTALVVSDTGIGIPAEDIDRVGEEFYRSRNAKHFAPTGTGIGMRIVRETIRRHDGRLDIRSKEGEGTTFLVELPLQPVLTESQ